MSHRGNRLSRRIAINDRNGPQLCTLDLLFALSLHMIEYISKFCGISAVKGCSNSKIEPILKANFFAMLMKIRATFPSPNHMNSLEIHKDSLESKKLG